MGSTLTRRTVLGGTAGLFGAIGAARAAADLPPTPACLDGDPATAPQSAGPFHTPGSPLKRDFRADDPNGVPLTLTGQVVSRRCVPLADLVADLWHADAQGRYDNRGFRLRGYQLTDAEGRFRFDTVVPGLYGGRTRHFHIKVGAPAGPVLTTQLYFPGEPRNPADGLFNPDLVMQVGAAGTGFDAVFGFVLDQA